MQATRSRPMMASHDPSHTEHAYLFSLLIRSRQSLMAALTRDGHSSYRKIRSHSFTHSSLVKPTGRIGTSGASDNASAAGALYSNGRSGTAAVGNGSSDPRSSDSSDSGERYIGANERLETPRGNLSPFSYQDSQKTTPRFITKHHLTVRDLEQRLRNCIHRHLQPFFPPIPPFSISIVTTLPPTIQPPMRPNHLSLIKPPCPIES